MGNKSSVPLILNGKQCNCKPRNRKIHCCQLKGCISSLGDMIQIPAIQGDNDWTFAHLHQQSLIHALNIFDHNTNVDYLVSIIAQYLNNSLHEYLIYIHGNNNPISICDKWYDQQSGKDKTMELKVIIFGEIGTGKSALVVQLVQNIFVKDYDPTIEDSWRKQIKFDDKTVMLDVLDTAQWDEFSNHSFRTISYYIYPRVFMLAFAINNKNGLQECKTKWDEIKRANDIDEFVENHSYQRCVILVATKLDLLYGTNGDHETKDIELRKKNQDDARKLSKLWNVPYIETSAKDNVNIWVLFERTLYEYWIQTQGQILKWDA